MRMRDCEKPSKNLPEPPDNPPGYKDGRLQRLGRSSFLSESDSSRSSIAHE